MIDDDKCVVLIMDTDQLHSLSLGELTSKLEAQANRIERLYQILSFRREEKITLDDVEEIFICSQILGKKLKRLQRNIFSEEDSNLSIDELKDVVDILSSIQISCHTASDELIDEEDEDNLHKFNRTVFKTLRKELKRFVQYSTDLKKLPVS
ncbi:MAG: hypothetical protein IPM39_04550 [Chloroflexi bacterium]|nr:hypothetical protein [Chloroflexota bacterium]